MSKRLDAMIRTVESMKRDAEKMHPMFTFAMANGEQITVDYDEAVKLAFDPAVTYTDVSTTSELYAEFAGLFRALGIG